MIAFQLEWRRFQAQGIPIRSQLGSHRVSIRMEQIPDPAQPDWIPIGVKLERAGPRSKGYFFSPIAFRLQINANPTESSGSLVILTFFI